MLTRKNFFFVPLQSGSETLYIAEPASSSLGVDALHACVPFVQIIGQECVMLQALGWLGIIPADLRAHLLSVSHTGEREARSLFGQKHDLVLIHFADFHGERAQQEMVQLLALPEPPTAVFVGNDEQCLGVYRALYECGIAIPDAMSVVGFDNMPYAEWVTPALTTIHQPLLEMGRVATKMVLRLIAGEPVEALRVELATPLIKRASCAPRKENP